MSIKGACLVLVAIFVLAIAAGCGDSDDSATGSSGEVEVETGSLSKAEFVKQANAICTQMRNRFYGEFGAFAKETQENPPKPSEPSPEEQLYPEIVAPNFRQQIEEISALGAPAGDEQQVSAFLNAFEDAATRAEEEPREFASSETRLAEVEKKAKKYGLESCAAPLGA